MLLITNLRKMVIVGIVWGFLGVGTMFGSESRDIQSTQKPSYTIGYAKFAKGSCTEYAASRRKDLFPSRNGRDRLFGGNAISWLPQAKRKGIPTSKQPSIGAIAVFGKGRGAGSSYGHVAIVEQIIDDHTIVVSDMNYVGHNIVSQRTISSKLALGYIHTRPPAIDKKPEIKKTKTTYTIPITLSIEKKPPQIAVGATLGGNINTSGEVHSETIIYATNTENSTGPEDDADTNPKIKSTLADIRYIMQSIATKQRTIDIV